MEEVRKYHNLVKRQLIRSVTKTGFSALDVGCGFGGDLQKWQSCYTNVDMCDPNSDSLIEARRRAEKLSMSVSFYEGDILACPEKVYDVVCYNFSLHYIFASRELFFKSIKAIRSRMDRGSVLVGCIPDSMSILMATPFKDEFENFMSRGDATGYGNFGEKLFVRLVDTPFYKDGPKSEPIAYKDLLITHLEDIGIRLVLWESLEKYDISKLYSRFIFVCT
jgi:SAM-dependent methyltransferase